MNKIGLISGDGNLPINIGTILKANNFDVVFTGKETIDYNGSQVGGMIAEMLDIPFVWVTTPPCQFFRCESHIRPVLG